MSAEPTCILIPPTAGPYASREQEAFAWFLREEARAARGPNVWPEPIGAFDLMKMPNPPDWFRRESEAQYRKGYRHAYETAVNDMAYLHRKGFSRTVEIINLLGTFCEQLRRWARSVFREDLNSYAFNFGSPTFKHDSWWDIRRNVFARDGRACMRCGRRGKLETHHIIPVCEGGLPEIKNLETVCFACHRGKKQEVRGDETCPDLPESESAALLIPLHLAIGYPWDWFSGNKSDLDLEGWWQLMPYSPGITEDFWDWHINNRRQWFNTKPEAAAALLRSFARWNELGKPTFGGQP